MYIFQLKLSYYRVLQISEIFVYNLYQMLDLDISKFFVFCPNLFLVQRCICSISDLGDILAHRIPCRNRGIIW
jgi:hypothetical protein